MFARGLGIGVMASLCACLPSQLRLRNDPTAITISVTVVDQRGTPVKQALITVKSRDRMVLSKQHTNRDGQALLRVRHQEYIEIWTEKDGYATTVHPYPAIPDSNEIDASIKIEQGYD